MATIVTRAGKGSPLTHEEVDANFTNLNDEAATKAPLANPVFTGDVTIADKIVHSGDTNTAIRFPAADTVTVETSGSERMRITSTGFVGIGTNTPQSELDVFGVGDIIRSTANDGASNFMAFFDATGRKAYLGYGGATDDMTLSNDRSGFLRFMTNGSTRATITSTGNVGIGTTSPAAQLHVSGTTTNIAQFTASITGTTMDVTAVATGTIAVGDIVYGANIAPITRITALGTGTGGVGTYTVSVSQTAASSAITYTGSPSASRIRISDTDVSSQTGQPAGSIEFFGSDTNTPGAGIGAYVSAVSEDSSPDTALTFGTRNDTGGGVDANERMRITSAGDVGIGTTSPAATLDVAGTGAMKVPVGTEAQRPTSATGLLRFNSDAASFEGYNGTEWGSIGGGATSDAVYENSATIAENITIATGRNGMSTGPITVNSGVTVTVSSGARYVVI